VDEAKLVTERAKKMEAYTAIISRRSIRKYTDQQVSEELIMKILQAGMVAPSAHDHRPWHFILITSREKLLAIPRFHAYAEMLKQAPMAIVICGDKRIEKSSDYILLDCSAATENMLLAAHALGLGAVWLALYPRQERLQGIIDLLQLPPSIFPVSMIAVGHPAEQKTAADRFDAARIHYNQW
jgi:nitroreductase